MKINEKHLAAFATSSAPVDKTGFLLKRGEMNKAFQRRWFELKGNLLFYYEKKEEREPVGVIILEGYTVELTESVDMFSFELVFPGVGSRTYVLATDSQEEMESWMRALTCANYDYMRLMVSELQGQLDDLNADHILTRWSPKTTSISQPLGEAQLVDLCVENRDSNFSQRSNPFNIISDMGTPNVDLFGATPFQPELLERPARTFSQLHEEYGLYMKDKCSIDDT